jgi:SAM-dependent methyltransferase
VAAVVADAQALPVRPGAAQVVVAENVLDLLDAPEAFLARVQTALAPRGRALVSTPSPALAGARVRRLVRRAGLELLEQAEALPWVRANSARHLEVYLVHALLLGRR